MITKIIIHLSLQMKSSNKTEDESNFAAINGLEINSPLGVGGNSVPHQELRSNMFYGALPIHFELAKELRNKQTEAEQFLWDYLKYVDIPGIRFKRQHPILYFIADFYCHKAKLVIEIDGGYHNIPKQYLYDQNRDSELEELGLNVIRFTNKQVLFDIENTLRTIKEEIQKRTSNNPKP